MAAVKPPSPVAGWSVALGSQTIAEQEKQLSRIRKHYIFKGYVQHRGFRMTTWRFAKDHHITGWVRNLPDGTVEMEAQGVPGRLWMFLRTLTSLEGVVREVEQTEIPTVEDEGWYLILVQR